MDIKILKTKPVYMVLVALLVIVIGALVYTAVKRNNNIYVPNGWIKHSVKYGPFLIAPQGWTFNFDKKNGSVFLNGTNGESAVIWPFFSGKPINAGAAGFALTKLERKVWPLARWNRPVKVLSNAVQSGGRNGTKSEIALLTWVNTPKGASLCLFAASAPTKDFNSSIKTFSRIFGSFRAAGPALQKKPARPQISYVTWQDPRERAFTVRVPSSWNISGGAFRYAPLDVRLEMRSISHGGKMLAQIGDASIPVYAIPNRLLSMGGYRPGMYYSPGYGIREIVWPYMYGLRYARYYATSVVSKECSALHLTGSKDRNDISSAANRSYEEYGLPIRLSVGEVKFSCIRNGEASSGYVFAGTYETQNLWGVMYLFVTLAPRRKFNEAMTILSHEIKTFKRNPQWVEMNEHISMNASRIISETGNKIANMISSSYNYRQKVMSEISRRRENAILGEVDVVDPDTGEDYKVNDGSNYYWMSPNGTVVGTNTDSVPNHDINFRKLMLRP